MHGPSSTSHIANTKQREWLAGAMESGNSSDNIQEKKRRHLELKELLKEVVLGEEEADIDVEAALDLPLPGRLELFMAVRSGHKVSLQQLASLEAVTTEQSSALHVVAAAGDGAGYLESAELIHREANQLLLACNKAGDTPLHCAARAGNTNMVLRLIKLAAGDTAAAMVRIQNKDGKTALHDAIGSGDARMVEELIKKDDTLGSVGANDGTSPLFLAFSFGHHRIARLLLDKKKNKKWSYSGPGGQNVLHAAVLHSKRMAATLLNSTDEETIKKLGKEQAPCGSTPMHFAASAADPSVEFFLFVFVHRSHEIYTPFSLFYYPWNFLYKFYAWTGHPIVRLAAADPSSVFKPDGKGWFPVHVAASVGSLVPIIILCHHTGCAGLRDSHGRTFLHVAVEKNRLNIVRFVCSRSEFKNIMNIQDNKGNTALHLAILGGNWDIFKSLIWNQHVHLNLQDNRGRTAMDIARIKSPLASGFYFGMHARRRILATLTFANAQSGNWRRDHFMEDCALELDDETHKSREAKESEKITSFAQVVGIGSVLVATATFAAAFTMPGGFNQDKDIPPKGKGGTPVLAGLYAFDGFIIANTLAFICSALATFSLIYTGVAALDINKRIKLVSFSLALLIGAARSFCAAFAFALYVLLAPVSRSHKAAFASSMLIVLALLDALWFMTAISTDTALVLRRSWVKLKKNKGWKAVTEQLLRLASRFLANIAYMFWPYIVIFSLLANRKITGHIKMG